MPGATRLRVVGAPRTQRMGYIRFRCTAVNSPSDGLSLRKIGFLQGSVDVTEMAKLRNAEAGKVWLPWVPKVIPKWVPITMV